jgi:abortive infection bacteriophage resistance protein
MNAPALKSFTSYAEQLQRLRLRGLEITNDAQALNILRLLGYYRLSGYYYPLRNTNPVGHPGRQDSFKPGSSFELISELTSFDKRLRMQLLYGLETVELAVRVAIAHRLGKFDPQAHLNPKLLDGRFTRLHANKHISGHQSWIERFNEKLSESKEDFVDHHHKQYDGQIPIWVAIEVWDFGMLSRFFAGMASRDRNALAMQFGAHDGEVLSSWLRMFNFVRNVSAHHSRLWNRRNPQTPVLPPLDRCRLLSQLHTYPDSKSKLFGSVSCLAVILRHIDPESTWASELKALLGTFPISNLISLMDAGFPQSWESTDLWALKHMRA